MSEHRTATELPPTDRRMLDRLHRQFAASLEDMADHIAAADLAVGKPHDTRYHLQEALEAMATLRLTLQLIDQHCGAMEAQLPGG